ncbi:MAG: ABC transporter permease subunit [Trueperaceae bacterium]|nr:ABC transporter permease subunit [Trueperaceae bacterium]
MILSHNQASLQSTKKRRSTVKSALKVMKYGFFDLLRSRWIIIYTLFYLVVTSGLLYFGGDANQAVLSTLNLVLLVVPLISLVLGLSYFYYTRDFIELILTQPIGRSSVFLGHFAGLALPLVAAFLLGSGLPFLLAGVRQGADWRVIASLMVAGTLVSLIFSALAFWIGLVNEERVKALGLALAVWLGLTMIYDGLLLLFSILMQAYPIERSLIILSLFNPIDLSRILVLLQLDTAALMGYTGAVFQRFFGSYLGILISLGSLILWTALPIYFGLRSFKKKNF